MGQSLSTVTEKLLKHESGVHSRVQGTYDKYKYFREMKDVLTKYEAYLLKDASYVAYCVLRTTKVAVPFLTHCLTRRSLNRVGRKSVGATLFSTSRHVEPCCKAYGTADDEKHGVIGEPAGDRFRELLAERLG
jgi:hypothetical protein